MLQLKKRNCLFPYKQTLNVFSSSVIFISASFFLFKMEYYNHVMIQHALKTSILINLETPDTS